MKKKLFREKYRAKNVEQKIKPAKKTTKNSKKVAKGDK